MTAILKDKTKILIKEKTERTFSYFIFLFYRLKEDNLKVPAGHLAYVSLLSLVPLLSIVFAVLSAFPMFEEFKNGFEEMIFNNFVPTAGNLVKVHLAGFIENTKKMTAMGVGSLIVIALLLIHSIDCSLNKIWRCENKRSKIAAFTMYWTILTLAPLLIGIAVAVSSYIFSLHMFSQNGVLSFGQEILSFMPFLLSWLMFIGVYTLVPNQRVLARHSIVGGFVAAMLFAVGTSLFGVYLTHFPTQQLIYGALAAIPILFVWIYVVWLIVLLGAEITSTLGEFLMENKIKNSGTSDTLVNNDQESNNLINHKPIKNNKRNKI